MLFVTLMTRDGVEVAINPAQICCLQDVTNPPGVCRIWTACDDAGPMELLTTKEKLLTLIGATEIRLP